MKPYVLIGCLLVLAGLALGEGWPRWRGPAAMGHVAPGVPVPTTLPAKPKVLWRAKIGFGLGSPVVGGKRVFILDNQRGKETVLAADAATGKELWRATLDETFRDAHSPVGPRSTPLVDGDRVYVLSCRGEFRCLGAADGKVIWRTNFVKDHGAVFSGERGAAPGASRHGYTGSPFIDGERMFVDVGGRSGASVVCFDKTTGRVIWKSQSDAAGHGGPIVATIAGVKQVVSFTADAAIGLAAADGKLLWRVPVKTRVGRHCITPVVIGDMVIVSSYLAGLIGIKVSQDGDGLRAERAWVNKSSPVNFSNPVAVGRYLYGLGRARKLICIDVRSGERAWAKDWTETRMFGKGYAAFIAMGRNVLGLAEDGTLFMIAADPKALRMVARAKVCGKNWCHPAYAKGHLFLRDAEALICLDLAVPTAATGVPTTWKQAMAAAAAKAKAGDFDYICDHMLAPAYVKTLTAKYGKVDWKTKFHHENLRSLTYYYGWLENPRVKTTGDTTVITGRHGCYATFITIDGKVYLGEFGQSLSSM